MGNGKDLWKMKKESLFIDFFQWMWGIHAPTHYRTACPYYWQYAGSMVILPVILIYKLLAAIAKPIVEWSDARDEMLLEQILTDLRKKMAEAKTDEEYYNLYRSIDYNKYSDTLEDKYEKSNKLYWIKRSAICDGYRNWKNHLKEKAQFKQDKIDAIKYGSIGTIASYILAVLVLVLVTWGIYELLHLFTMHDFIKMVILVGLVIGIVAAILGIGSLVQYTTDKYWRDSWLHKIVFWKYVGIILMGIVTGFKMFFDMIKSIYTKSCPVIDWV